MIEENNSQSRHFRWKNPLLFSGISLLLATLLQATIQFVIIYGNNSLQRRKLNLFLFGESQAVFVAIFVILSSRAIALIIKKQDFDFEDKILKWQKIPFYVYTVLFLALNILFIVLDVLDPFSDFGEALGFALGVYLPFAFLSILILAAILLYFTYFILPKLRINIVLKVMVSCSTFFYCIMESIKLLILDKQYVLFIILERYEKSFYLRDYKTLYIIYPISTFFLCTIILIASKKFSKNFINK